MIEGFKRYLFLILAILALVVAVVVEHGLLKNNPEKILLKDFQEKLLEKEANLDNHLKEIYGIIKGKGFSGDYSESLHSLNQCMENEGSGFLVYEGTELKFWSDQVISFSNHLDSINLNERLVRLPNGIYLAKKLKSGNLTAEGLILIRNSYPHENVYLQNSFQKDFKLPDEYKILQEPKKNAFPVYSKSGDYLFSVLPAGDVLCTKSQLYLPGFIYLLMLVFALIFVRCEFKKSSQPLILKLSVLTWGLFIFYWLHILFQYPKVFYILDFFSPDYFGYSIWLPSLGDYSLVSLFFFFCTLNFKPDLEINLTIPGKLLPAKVVLFVKLSGLGIIYIAINHFIRILIENSSFSFPLNHITELTTQSVIAYFSISLLLLGLAILTIKITEVLREVFSAKEIIFTTLMAALILLLIQYVFASVSLPVIALFIIFIILLLVFNKDYFRQFTLSYLIILVSLFSLYSLFIIYGTVSDKERGALRHYAFNLETKHDPAAELLLLRIQNQINVDSVIPTLLIPPYDEVPELDNYIVNRYFGGYFRSYDVQVTSCTGADSLDIQPDNITVPCFPYFDERIEREGLEVEGTNFYFMDDINGRITYFGKLHYPLSFDSTGITVFIELNSSVVSEGIGYPELLMDRSMIKPESYKWFDYAIYVDGQLVDQHGDFDYNENLLFYNFPDEELNYLKTVGHEHIINHIREGNYVVVSRNVYGFLEYLISFPYLFVFYFLLTVVFLLTWNKSLRKRSMVFDLKFKVQAAIISIILLSLLVVALGTVFYNVDTYRTKHRDDLNEKMKSVAEEIEMRKDKIKDPTPENLDWLFNELFKLSNIFRTDINIYGVNGELIATSRPEIYEKGLISTRMNSDAYFELDSRFRINFSQPEKIGALSYLSAYKPIFNDAGTQYLGFINLPYFTRQDTYRQEITTFIVAFINLYVILFLASIIVAVFLSNQITKPLTLIRENLRKMQLGKRSEPIDYARNDEIGSLVKEYNKKVDELAASAELLARSERESAWREMAKQIAHEIKNPLTPMKLNIQYLQRLKNDPKELEDNIEKVTRLLIEQIDDLSSIATEFSSFAQIPTARNQIFNISEQLHKVINLFETHEKTNIHINFEGAEDIRVNADREQFSRAIINLVKNAIQAIPAGQEGIIGIYLARNGDYTQIRITDNGTGIPEELQEKMFSPSFTTKSSGMGLGLAIVKNIAENFNGHIWFETFPGKGTTFFIEIPVFEGSIK